MSRVLWPKTNAKDLWASAASHLSRKTAEPVKWGFSESGVVASRTSRQVNKLKRLARGGTFVTPWFWQDCAWDGMSEGETSSTGFQAKVSPLSSRKRTINREDFRNRLRQCFLTVTPARNRAKKQRTKKSVSSMHPVAGLKVGKCRGNTGSCEKIVMVAVEMEWSPSSFSPWNLL